MWKLCNLSEYSLKCRVSLAMDLSEKTPRKDAIRFLYDNVHDFKGTAEHVESEIRRLGIFYDSWEEVPGAEGRIHHEMWVSLKTVSHFNLGTALELMLKLMLFLNNIPLKGVRRNELHSLTSLYDTLPEHDQQKMSAAYREITRDYSDQFAVTGFVNRPHDAPGPSYRSPSRNVLFLRGFLEYWDQYIKWWTTRYSWELVRDQEWRYYFNDFSPFVEFINRTMRDMPRDSGS